MTTGNRWAAIAREPYELYQDWQAARDDAQLAYAHWCEAVGDKSEAHVIYRAAADREDAAAEAWMLHDRTGAGRACQAEVI
jgi:hypothetical protein